MITLKEFLEAIEYKITEGSDYGWDCYGDNVHRLDRQIGDHRGNTVTCVFDTQEHFLYELEVWDNANDRVYRWLNPAFLKAYKKACKQHGVKFKTAFDDTKWIDIEVEEDILQKARAVAAGEEYDTRIMVPVTFDDDELLRYMKLAHECDMTFNELVEEALVSMIDAVKSGRITPGSIAEDLDDDVT